MAKNPELNAMIISVMKKILNSMFMASNTCMDAHMYISFPQSVSSVSQFLALSTEKN